MWRPWPLKWPLVIFLLDRSERLCRNQKGSTLLPQVDGNSGPESGHLKGNMAIAELRPSGRFALHPKSPTTMASYKMSCLVAVSPQYHNIVCCTCEQTFSRGVSYNIHHLTHQNILLHTSESVKGRLSLTWLVAAGLLNKAIQACMTTLHS